MAITQLSSTSFLPIDWQALRQSGGAFPGIAPASPFSPLGFEQNALQNEFDELPEEVKQRMEEFIQARQSEFGPSIDTPDELRRLLQQLHQGEGRAQGLKKLDGAQAEDLQNLDSSEMLQMLIDYLANFNQNSERNQPAPRSVGSLSPSPGGGYSGGGGGGAPMSSGGGGGGTTSGVSGSGGAGGVSPSGAPTDTSSLKGNTNAQKAFNYFVQKGLTPQQAAGIVGNLQAESGVKPGQHQIGGPAFGIAQWEGGRQTNLQNFARQQGKSVDDLGVQLDFLWQELQGPENAAFQALKGAGSAAEAAAIFENKFERPAANHNAERGALAEAALREFGNGGGSMA